MLHVWEIVVRLRPVLFVAAFAFLALSLPSQILELYLINIETVDVDMTKITVLTFLQQNLGIAISIVTGLFAMLMLWLGSLHLLCLAPGHESWNGPRRWLANGLLISIPLSIPLGIVLGLNTLRTNIAQIAPDNAALSQGLDLYMWATAATAVLSAVVLAALSLPRFERRARWANWAFSHVSVTVGALTFLVLTLAMAHWPTGVPWALGTLGIIFLSFSTLAFLLTWFSQIYQRTGWPVTVILSALAFIFSLLGWNNNHEVKFALSDTPAPRVEAAFPDWLMARADKDWYREQAKPYPVYVVAAEGGGMYAAYHAASWLSKIQDKCPNFAQHVFAINSVSGGSLGSGVFTALASRLAPNSEHQDCSGTGKQFSDASKVFFANDLLAPLVGSTLFPDFLQRVVPMPIAAFDRAAALEETFAVAWDQTAATLGPEAKPNAFRAPIQKTWSVNGAAPALMPLTTSVTSGAQVMLGPIWFNATNSSRHLMEMLCPPFGTADVQVSLASAVSLSARFPWMTPAGWFDADAAAKKCPHKESTGRVYLADGGFYENSGLEAAIGISKWMRAAFESRDQQARMAEVSAAFPQGIDIRIITIFTVDTMANSYMKSEAERTYDHPGELDSPIATMLAGRVARTRAVYEAMLSDRYLPFASAGSPAHGYGYTIRGSNVVHEGNALVHQVPLDGTKFFLPLGWRLSKRSIATISDNADAASDLALDFVTYELEGRDTVLLKAAHWRN